MNHINAMIVDDEPGCTEMLSLLLRRYHPDVQLQATASSAAMGLSVLERLDPAPDIVFLDIQLGGGDGFSLLQQLPVIPFRVIFTTAFDQYAIRAVRFSALDYLLKPIDHQELSAALTRFRELQSGEEDRQRMNDFRLALRERSVFDKLAVPMLNEIKLIPVQDIAYLESDNNYTSICLDDCKRIVSSRNIGYYEELLRASGFLRIHNSCLVNLQKISTYVKGKGGSVKLDNGIELDVSSRRKEQLMKALFPG